MEMLERKPSEGTAPAPTAGAGPVLLAGGVLLLVGAGLLLWWREGERLFTDGLVAALLACF